MRRYTRTGRIVYDRPKHLFNTKDWLRLSKKTNAQIFEIPQEKWQAFEEIVKKAFEEAHGETLQVYMVLEDGGEFGGAGATRSFESTDQGSILPRMIFFTREGI